MASDLAQAKKLETTVQQLRGLLLSIDSAASQKSALKRGSTRSDRARKIGYVLSVREANSKVSPIVKRALEGGPQVIPEQGGGAVVVMGTETAAHLVAQVEKPRSFADMFPVTTTDPPVQRLKITARLGPTKVTL